MCCNNNCSLLALLFSFVVGVIIAVITFFVTLPLLFVPIAIILAIALLAIILLTGLILFLDYRLRHCLNNFGTCLVISIIGVIVSTIIYFATLGLTIPILTAIIVFFIVFFFTLLLIYLTLLFICLVRVNCNNLLVQTVTTTEKNA